MSRTSIPNVDKAAILLYSLAPHAADFVLNRLGEPHASRLRELMDWYSKTPDVNAMVDEVVTEFSQIQQGIRTVPSRFGFVKDGSNAREKMAAYEYALDEDLHKEMEEGGAAKKDEANEGEMDVGDDPLAKLQEIQPTTLMRVLANEHPRAVGMVLQYLEPEKAAELLKLLPPELRQRAFVLLAGGLPESPELVQRVIGAVVEKCNVKSDLPQKEGGGSEDSQYRSLAEILHSCDREERNAMMAALREQNAAFAEKVDQFLYDFEDLLKVDDRSVQKVLAEIDQKVLAVAMFNSSEDLVAKVMGNMSERVRAMLAEEREYLGAVPTKKVEEARREICAVIRRHDRDGTLVWKNG